MTIQQIVGAFALAVTACPLAVIMWALLSKGEMQ